MAKPTFDANDIAQHKLPGAIGYLVFFVPLILCPKSKFGRYCGNQGLLLLIGVLALRLIKWILGALLGWVPIVGGLIALVLNLATIAIVLLALYFAYLAYSKGDARAIPYVGEFQIIK